MHNERDPLDQRKIQSTLASNEENPPSLYDHAVFLGTVERNSEQKKVSRIYLDTFQVAFKAGFSSLPKTGGIIYGYSGLIQGDKALEMAQYGDANSALKHLLLSYVLTMVSATTVFLGVKWRNEFVDQYESSSD